MLLNASTTASGPQYTKGVLAGIFAIILWALAPALVKLQSTSLPILYFLVLRYGFSTVLFIPMLRRISWKRLSSSRLVWIGLVVSLVLHLGFQVLALRELPISWYVVFFALSPMLSLILLRVRWSLELTIAFALAALGSVLFVETNGLPSLIGISSLLISIASWSAVTLAIKKIQTNLEDLEITGICNVISFSVFAVIWFLSGAEHSPLTLSDGLFIGVLSLGVPVAFLLFSYSLRHSPITAIFSQFLEPVFGVLAGMIFFKESLTAFQFLGMALILASSYRILNSLSHQQER